MKRTGVTMLPLHGGRAPRWLFKRMVGLSASIVEALVIERGPQEFLRRISDPRWFQAFSCVLGFDWHSSGTTTTTCGALKVSLTPEVHGVCVAGGKGRASKNTQSEIDEFGRSTRLGEDEVSSLKYASRMSAKVDGSCVLDGFQLYHHSFFATEDGCWAVVQQGMSDDYARRYHWLSDKVDSFVCEPHAGISCEVIRDSVMDLTAAESELARATSVDLVNDGPEHIKRFFKSGFQKTLNEFTGEPSRFLVLPARHPVLKCDLSTKDLEVLKNACEIQPESYEELVSLQGMGPKKIRALALIAKLVFGAPVSLKDPVKYSFAHGGKDGFPYPVDRAAYDNSIHVLREAVEEARLGQKEKFHALKRLDDFI